MPIILGDLSLPTDPKSRNLFLEKILRAQVSSQIRSLREARGWSQGHLGALIRTPQNGIARFESPKAGNWTFTTLLRLSEAFDSGLVIRFCEWPLFLSLAEEG